MESQFQPSLPCFFLSSSVALRSKGGSALPWELLEHSQGIPRPWIQRTWSSFSSLNSSSIQSPRCRPWSEGQVRKNPNLQQGKTSNKAEQREKHKMSHWVVATKIQRDQLWHHPSLSQYHAVKCTSSGGGRAWKMDAETNSRRKQPHELHLPLAGHFFRPNLPWNFIIFLPVQFPIKLNCREKVMMGILEISPRQHQSLLTQFEPIDSAFRLGCQKRTRSSFQARWWMRSFPSKCEENVLILINLPGSVCISLLKKLICI